MKYIREKNTVVMFSDHLVHRDVANQLHLKPESAGFVSIEAIDEETKVVRCHGESITLDIKSKPEEDAELIQILLKL